MKILCVSDNEEYELYEGWTDEEAEKLKDIGLILSAGDLDPEYLEFLVTMLNVPLLYVRGNHDSRYDEEPPEGCIDIDDKVAEIVIGRDGTGDVCDNVVQEIPGTRMGVYEKAELRKGAGLIRIAGLGGSIYHDAGESEMYPPEDEFTEEEMKARAGKLKWVLKDYSLADRVLSGMPRRSDGTFSPLDILLTHSPSFGHGDLPDRAHMGFKCFNEILMEIKPAYHIYGHVHMEYGRIDRESVHPSGTNEINVSGMYILDV